MVDGRNGGKIKRRQKGDPAEPGAGRPPGSKSFKTLLEDALAQTTKGKDGQPIELKRASALQLVGILLSSETDDNTKLKAFQLIRDTIGEAPATKISNDPENPFDGGGITLVFNTEKKEPVTSEAAMQAIFEKFKEEI